MLGHHRHMIPFERETIDEREALLVEENRRLREAVGELRRANDQLGHDMERVNRTLDHMMDELGRKKKQGRQFPGEARRGSGPG